MDGGKVALLNIGEIMRETQVLIVNRGMTIPLTLPNGTISYPSAEIPPIKVWSVYLGHKTRKDEVATYTDSDTGFPRDHSDCRRKRRRPWEAASLLSSSTYSLDDQSVNPARS